MPLCAHVSRFSGRSRSERGKFVVKPCSAWINTNDALGFTPARFNRSETETPVNRLSNRLQRVTQWMSQSVSLCGSARISS